MAEKKSKLFPAEFYENLQKVLHEAEDSMLKEQKRRHSCKYSGLPCQHCTVKPVLSSHSRIGKTKVLKTDGSLMQVKSIAECSSSLGAFCNTFDLH